MKQKKWQVMTLAVLLLITMLAAPITAAPGQGVEPADYLVGFHGSPNPGLVRAFGGEVNAEYQLVDVVAASLPVQALKGLRNHPAISYVEEDAQVFALGQEVPWGIDRVFDGEESRTQIWNNDTGESISVAVLDTGIATHLDLDIAGGRRFTMVNTGPPSRRGLLEDGNYHDGNGHGTHVAGTIGALNNSIGVVGVAPSVDLYAVKVLDDSGSGSTSAIIAGIEWAVNNNLNIINMSLGSSTYSKSFDDACQKAYYSGVLIISSAGNSGNDDGTGDTVGYPAQYASVIAVAASDSDDNRASFSSTGTTVELIAPGVSVRSTVPGNQYASYSGTSMASPHVAGVAALVWSANPTLNNTKIRSILAETAHYLDLDPKHQGKGLVRADKAVAAAAAGGGTEPVITYTITATAADGGSISPSGDVKVEEGKNQEFIILPLDGYEIEGVMVDNEPKGLIGSFTFEEVIKDHTIAATFVKKTYTLIYTAGNYGSIEGTTPQTVEHGSDGTSVEAIPEDGYKFINWSDGLTENPRTDTNVTQDISVTANFAQTSNDASTLNVSIEEPLNNPNYKYNERVNIKVLTMDQNDQTVADATVTVTVKDPVGATMGTYTGNTTADGIFTASYRVANRSLIGLYAIEAKVIKEGSEPADLVTVNFKVTGK